MSESYLFIVHQVTGHIVLVADVTQYRLLFFADRHLVSTTGVEPASGGRVNRRRHIAFEDDAVALVFGVGHRYGG